MLVMGIDQAEPLVDLHGYVSRMDIALQPGADPNEGEAPPCKPRSRSEDVAQVSTPQIEDNRGREALAPLKVGTMIVSTGALVVGLFLIFMILSVSVTERRHTIGVLRSIGATRGQIRNLFLMEAALLGFLGAAAGVPLGLGLARLMLGSISQLVSDALFPVPMMSPTLAELRWFLLSAVVAGMATALIAAFFPACEHDVRPARTGGRRLPCPTGAGLPARLLQPGHLRRAGPSWRGAGHAAGDSTARQTLCHFQWGQLSFSLASFLGTALFSVPSALLSACCVPWLSVCSRSRVVSPPTIWSAAPGRTRASRGPGSELWP